MDGMQVARTVTLNQNSKMDEFCTYESVKRLHRNKTKELCYAIIGRLGSFRKVARHEKSYYIRIYRY